MLDWRGVLQSVLPQSLFELWRYEAVRLAVGVVVCVLAVKLAYAFYCWRRWAAAGIDQIDTMSGLEFEQYLERHFRRMGYQVDRTQYSGDFGADLVVAQKDERCVIQAKRKSSSVGVAAIQQAVAARAMYDCDHAMVVTNNRFTQQAEALATANDVELWDRERLIEEILRASSRRLTTERPVRENAETEALSELPAVDEPEYRPHAARESSAEPAPIRPLVRCRICGRRTYRTTPNNLAADGDPVERQFYCQIHQRHGSAPRRRSATSRSRRSGDG